VAVLTRSQSKRSRKTNKVATPEAPSPRLARDTEAPDRGASKPEAPETGRVRLFEAPDAGEGRSSFVEHEFTHGRSQS
jgi:hypothetical protein